MKESFSKFITFATTPHRLYAASILRVGLAALTALLYVTHFKQRVFLWGINGQTDWGYYAAFTKKTLFTLYAFSGNAVWPELLFWAGLAVSIAYMLGIFPRVTSILFLCTTASLYNRNFEAIDGGQNLLLILSIYLCFADTGAHLSLSRDWPLAKKLREKIGGASGMLVVLHNFAVFMIAAQICMLYYWSGFYKITGHKWQDGTAVYYVMRSNEFRWPPFSQMIYQNAYLVSFLTLSTLLFQGSFPVLMWIKRAKPFLFVGAFLFHLGIAAFMGLVMFSATMIVADLAIFSDDFYEALFAWFRRVPARLGALPRAEGSTT